MEKRQWIIGRASDCDLVVNHPSVSSRHCRLVETDEGFLIEDLHSTNGTFVNGVLALPAVPVTRGDRVTLGLGVPMPWPEGIVLPSERLASAGRDDAHSVLDLSAALRGKPIVFGREPSCDQVLNYPMISRRHARLYRSGNALVLEDLGSTNGTFLNRRRIKQPTAVQVGDVIGLGSFTYQLIDPSRLEKFDFRGNVTLEAKNVTIDVPKRRLLENVSLTIYPSEFVGLMGPSGAGKTTLMNALNGYTPPTAGRVFLNGQDLYANYAQFSSYLGYVPQDDIMHRDLTVGQALYYTARLRLPADYAEPEINNRIREVLKQLGLEGTENVLIGSPERKGISGGQRKRVNLAMELLTDPLVLFLDEPTSGLSSEDALIVMKVLW